MKLPSTDKSLLLRTDFSDEAAWASLCEALEGPIEDSLGAFNHFSDPSFASLGDAVQEPNQEGFRAFVDCVSDPAYDGLTVEQLVVLAPKGGGVSFALIADRATFTNPERPILVVDLYAEPGRTFRVTPRETWGVVANLSISNMDYADFADLVDPDGVFRGFPQP